MPSLRKGYSSKGNLKAGEKGEESILGEEDVPLNHPSGKRAWVPQKGQTKVYEGK